MAKLQFCIGLGVLLVIMASLGTRYLTPEASAPQFLSLRMAAAHASASADHAITGVTIGTTSTTSISSFHHASGALIFDVKAPALRYPWWESSTKVTLHMGMLVDESDHLARLPTQLSLMSFCFDEIFVVFDLPHGGCNYGPVRLKGGPATVAKFMHSGEPAKLLEEADRVFEKVRALHGRHCRNHLKTRASIIDYESPFTHNMWKTAFDLEFEPPSAKQSNWPFAFMWKTGMAYTVPFVNSSNEHVLHLDDDISIRRLKAGVGIGRYVEASIEELRTSAIAVSCQLLLCGETNVEVSKLLKYRQDNSSIRYYYTDPNKGKYEWTSIQLFLSTKTRFMQMKPFRYWRHFSESVYAVSASRAGLKTVSLQVPEVCKTNYPDAMKRNNFTEEEKREMVLEAKSFATNAVMESFDTGERHGSCKFR